MHIHIPIPKISKRRRARRLWSKTKIVPKTRFRYRDRVMYTRSVVRFYFTRHSGGDVDGNYNNFRRDSYCNIFFGCVGKQKRASTSFTRTRRRGRAHISLEFSLENGYSSLADNNYSCCSGYGTNVFLVV